MTLSDETLVAIAIGVPSFFISLLSLWITHRMFSLSVRLRMSQDLFKQGDPQLPHCNPPLYGPAKQVRQDVPVEEVYQNIPRRHTY